MNNRVKIEIRKIVPVAAVISAGKSKLLNAIYNIDFLECKEGIATKFINILRYNPDITIPCFYHLNVIKEGEKYEFYKDLNEIYEGKQKIIEANKNINKKLSEENNIKYEDIFYMTEINESPFIKDKDYLLTHDLCDIPGLNEYQGNYNNLEQFTSRNTKNESCLKQNDLADTSNEEKEDLLFLKKTKKIIKPLPKKNFNFNKDNEIEMITFNEDNTKEKEKNEKIEDEMFYATDVKENTYISEIFKILKNFIDGLIIILSIENYFYNINFEIITKLRKITGKEILNCLIILNKMDLSDNPEEDIKKCKGEFISHFQKFQTFNINLNTFIPLSVVQVENELLMDKSFRHLINYHFMNCLSKAKQIKTPGIANKPSFIRHLEEIIKAEKIKVNDIKQKISQLNKENNISEINKEIKSIIYELDKQIENNNEITLGINNIEDLNDETEDSNDETEDDEDLEAYAENNPINIIKLFYFYHKQKKFIPPFSGETRDLLEYFSNKKKVNYKIGNISDQQDDNLKIYLNERMENLLLSLYNKLSNSKIESYIIKDLKKEILETIENMKISNRIIIPFLGPPNSGKSSIINGIIGRNVLPTGKGGCTKRGVIIIYSNQEEDIIISKVKIKEENIIDQIYYDIEKGNIIGKGLKKVRETLEGLNLDYPSKEEDFLYCIHTKIKLFDDLELNDSLKKMIYLIDLPGYGTSKNFFDYSVSKKLISISNYFFFVLKNSVIREDNTKIMIEQIFQETKTLKQKIRTGIINSCLFILNNFVSKEVNEDDLKRSKNDLQKLLDINPNEKDEEEKTIINFCIYNAKYFCDYCENLIYFFNLKETLKKEYNIYLENKAIFYKFPGISKIKIYKSFCEYLIKRLYNQIEEKYKVKTKNIKSLYINDNIKRELNNIFVEFSNLKYIQMNEIMNYENKIGEILTYGQDKIKNLKEFRESNIEALKIILNTQFYLINKNREEELNEKIHGLLISFEDIFKIDFNDKKDKLKEIQNLELKIIDIKSKLIDVCSENDKTINNFFNAYKKFLEQYLDEQKENIKNNLKTKSSSKILGEIDKDLENKLEDMNAMVITLLKDINNKTEIYFEEAGKEIKEFSEGKIILTLNRSFINYLLYKIGDKNKNIYEQLNVELKSTKSIFKIYRDKGFSDFIKSSFSNYHYLINNFELMLNDFEYKIN